jgi:hypothetical protein
LKGLLCPRKERIKVSDNGVIFCITKEDVIGCARQMGIPEKAITDDVLEGVKKGVEFGLDCWAEVVQEAINIALKG